MEIRLESKAGPPVLPPAQLLDQLAAQLRTDHQTWLHQLSADPRRFADVEVAVHHTFQHLADQRVASLLAQATQQSPALEAAQKK